MSPSRILSVVLAASFLPVPQAAWAVAPQPGDALGAPQPSGSLGAPQPVGELAENLARYQRIAEDLRVTIAQTGVIRRQIDELQHQIDERRAAVGRVAAATYRGHRIHPLYVLTGAGSQDDAVRRMVLVNGFAERQQQEIDALSLTQARYDSAQRTLESLIAQQRSQQQALNAQRRKLQQRQ